MNKEEIINLLYKNQLENVNIEHRLFYKDIIRIASKINTDPFSPTECCIWNGAISYSYHNSKYINFWLKKKKQPLHRILYNNYKGNLPSNKYIRYLCPDSNSKGICCNINHIDIINNDNNNNNTHPINNENKKNYIIDIVDNNLNHDLFVIIFE